MKLERAIEILTDQYKRHKVGGDLNYRDAIKLGIEAGKREQHYRTLNQPCFTRLLPGETKD